MPLQAKAVLPGGCTKGELTQPGQLQSRDLGQWLRQRYVQKMAFLSPEYQASLYPVHTMSKPCNRHGMPEILRSDPLPCAYPLPWPACNTFGCAGRPGVKYVGMQYLIAHLADSRCRRRQWTDGAYAAAGI